MKGLSRIARVRLWMILNLIYDWNSVDYEYHRNHQNHPHGIWFDDETLRDGLQSPSARNPTIEQKLELLDYMEKLGIQKVDLGLPGAGPSIWSTSMQC